MEEVDYDYDIDDSLLEKIDKLIGKYKLDILTLINKELLEKENKIFAEVYTEEQGKKRREVYDRLKLYLIEKKKNELKGKGEELLTEENLRKWIEEDGETYISIAINHTGCLYTIVSQKAKEFKIESQRENFIKSSDVKDIEVEKLVSEYSIDDILNGVHKYVTKSKHINEMTIREKVLMEYNEPDYDLMEKEKLEGMIQSGLTMRDMVEKIGCSFQLLKVYLNNYGLSEEEVKKNKESKGKQIRNKVIRKKYARY
jgi:hypothetical protein